MIPKGLYGQHTHLIPVASLLILASYFCLLNKEIHLPITVLFAFFVFLVLLLNASYSLFFFPSIFLVDAFFISELFNLDLTADNLRFQDFHLPYALFPRQEFFLCFFICFGRPF